MVEGSERSGASESPERDGRGDLAVVLGGGGARAAYQVGVLRSVARSFPDLEIPIVTGMSAGAINAAHLAAHHGDFTQSVSELDRLWCELRPERIFRVDPPSLFWNVARAALRLLSGGVVPFPEARGMVDTSPLRDFLREALHTVDGEVTGIDYNLDRGRLRACAIVTTNYTTGQSVTWVQARDGAVPGWTRPLRKSVLTSLNLDHVMASAALPLFFPAVRIGEHWYGDGGIRLFAPVAPALHLGADRILAISSHYSLTHEEAERPRVADYPPPAQVMSVLVSSIFLDLLDQDVHQLERINELVEHVPDEVRRELGLRRVEVFTMRPSVDLGRLAQEYEPELPRAFRFLTRGLGTKETESPDFLSILMFQEDFLGHAMRIGEEDAEARKEELAAFFGADGS